MRQALRHWLASELGLRPDPGHEDALVRALQDRSISAPRLEAHLADLRPGTDDYDWLVERATIAETHLMREPNHFRFIEHEAARKTSCGAAPLRVWSAACSTGAEAFSAIAAILGAGHRGSVLATDVSALAVAKARRGRLRRDQVRSPLPLTWSESFRSDGADFQLSESARQLIRFRVHNLLSPLRPPEAPFDVILARNVAMYFHEDARKIVWRQLWECLAPEGMLLVASAELSQLASDGWPVAERNGVFGLARAPLSEEDRSQSALAATPAHKSAQGGDNERAAPDSGRAGDAQPDLPTPDFPKPGPESLGTATEELSTLDQAIALLDMGQGPQALATLDQHPTAPPHEARGIRANLHAALLLDAGQSSAAAQRLGGESTALSAVIRALIQLRAGELAPAIQGLRRVTEDAAATGTAAAAVAWFHLAGLADSQPGSSPPAPAARRREWLAKACQALAAPSPTDPALRWCERLLVGGVRRSYVAQLCRRQLERIDSGKGAEGTAPPPTSAPLRTSAEDPQPDPASP